MVVASEEEKRHRCFWCKKEGKHEHSMVKDNSTSDQTAGIWLCDTHDEEMKRYRRKRVSRS